MAAIDDIRYTEIAALAFQREGEYDQGRLDDLLAALRVGEILDVVHRVEPCESAELWLLAKMVASGRRDRWLRPDAVQEMWTEAREDVAFSSGDNGEPVLDAVGLRRVVIDAIQHRQPVLLAEVARSVGTGDGDPGIEVVTAKKIAGLGVDLILAERAAAAQASPSPAQASSRNPVQSSTAAARANLSERVVAGGTADTSHRPG